MRALITGGAGFIGSALGRALLARGADVTVVDNLVTGRREWLPDGARFHCLSIADRQLDRVFEEDGPFDYVFPRGAQGRAQGTDRSRRSEERRVGKECRSRWSPYH